MIPTIKNRVKRLQESRQPKMLATPVYDCMVDGEHQELSPLDIACAYMDGHNVIQGQQCRTVYTPVATPAEYRKNLEEMQEWVRQCEEEYNSPESVAKRQAEYEELQRIGQLRAQDFYSGRDMDECHPLPWTKKG